MQGACARSVVRLLLSLTARSGRFVHGEEARRARGVVHQRALAAPTPTRRQSCSCLMADGASRATRESAGLDVFVIAHAVAATPAHGGSEAASARPTDQLSCEMAPCRLRATTIARYDGSSACTPLPAAMAAAATASSQQRRRSASPPFAGSIDCATTMVPPEANAANEKDESSTDVSRAVWPRLARNSGMNGIGNE